MPKTMQKPLATPVARLMPLLGLPLLALAACASQTPIPATDGGTTVNVGCVEFSRLTFSRLHDTDETIKGVKEYDAARDKVCGVGK